jgi:hypothetical protein
MLGHSGVKCAGVYDPLCWTHAATAVAPASIAPPGILSASSLSMSDDSRYALAAQSLGRVFLSVLPLSHILLLSESSIYPVSLYIDDEFAGFTTSNSSITKFLNPNMPHVLAIETVPNNSFAVILDGSPCRASQWKCIVSGSVDSHWKHPNFDDSAWESAYATSFIASASSYSSFSGVDRSSQWIGSASGTVSVSGLDSNTVTSPTVSIFDSFYSNILNSVYWAYTKGPSDSFVVGGGLLVLTQRPIIRSAIRFNSFPITVSGTFKFDYIYDFLTVCTRSNAVPFDTIHREINGLRFFFGPGSWPGAEETLSIGMRISDSQFNGPLVTRSATSWKAVVGVTYNFRVVDGGSFAQIFIDNKLELTHSAISQSFMPGSYLAFYNRESSPSLTMGPISATVNDAISGLRLFCRSLTPVFRGGRTFTSISSLPTTTWVDVAVSASGIFQIVAANNQLFMSTNGGADWQQVSFPASLSTSNEWSRVALSGDGSVVVAATSFKFIFVRSNDNWVQSRITASWKSVALSYDGSRIVAAADNNGGIFFSTNFGNSWSQNLGIRFLGKDWTSVSVSGDGRSIIAASNWVGQVKEVIPYFVHNFVVLNSTCNHFASSQYGYDFLSRDSPNHVAQYSLIDYNPNPSSGIDTHIITFTCTKISGSLLHGFVTSLADSQSERRLFCSSSASGDSWKSPDFDDSTWELPSVVNLTSATALNPNATNHIAKSWIVDRPSYISSTSQILWAPNPSASSFSCRYKLPAHQLQYQDWIRGTSSTYMSSASQSLMSNLWRDATVSERGTSWSAPTPLGYTTDSPVACNGANVGSDLYQAQLACEKCIQCHSILRVGTNPGTFSLRRGTNAQSDFEQQTTNHFWASGFRAGSVPTSYLNLQDGGRYNSVSEASYQSSVWFLGRQVGIAESHDFGRTWFARSSQKSWSRALLSSDGNTVLACLNGKLLKTHTLNFIVVSLGFDAIVSNSSAFSKFSIFGSVSRGVGIVSQYSALVPSNSYIVIHEAAFNSFTVMFWLQTSSACSAAVWQSGCAIFHASASNRSLGIYIASGKLFFHVGAPDVVINTSLTVNDARWHFIAASWNASTGAMKLYVDAEVVGFGDSLARDDRLISQMHSIKLGGSPLFSGSYDDVRVFSVAFGYDTIQNVFNRSLQMSMPYGASTKMSFKSIDDDVRAPALGSCSSQSPNSMSISDDGSHLIAVLQPAASLPSIYDFNSNRRLEPSDCVDIDECSLGTHNCAANQTCFNTQGSFACNCSTGFKRVGNQCIDVDECAISTTCGSTMNCINTVGSFTCACKQGYGNVGCVDINECGATISPCPLKSICANTPGSFTCACPSGTSLNGSACIDINECEIGAHNCITSPCINSFGSFYCLEVSSKVYGIITSVFTGRTIASAEVYVISNGASGFNLVASTFTFPADNGTFSLDVPASTSTNISYQLLVKSFHNADVYVPFNVFANTNFINVDVQVFQYCESVLAASATSEYSGCINSDPNKFIAVPSVVSISKNISLFGAKFPIMTCEARFGINITSDPGSFFVAHSCEVTSSMTAVVLANSNTDAFEPLQVQLLFRPSVGSDIVNVLTSEFGIITLLNGTVVLQHVSPASG